MLLLVAFSWLFRGFFVALICLEKQCLGLLRGLFVFFFLARTLGKSVYILALEESSEERPCGATLHEGSEKH